VRRPTVSVDVEPIVGEQTMINLKSLPTVAKLITEIVNKEINDLVFPKRLPMEVPCVHESLKIDREGKIITS
jgi:Ca2+-dependent lipid-binding protein